MGDSEFETFFFALKLLGKQFYERISLINSILNKYNNEYCSILRKMSIIKKKVFAHYCNGGFCLYLNIFLYTK